MRDRLLNSNEAFALWKKFGKEVGLKALQDSYGSYWPRGKLLGEIVIEWEEDNELTDWFDTIGWTAIRRDVLEPIFWINVGIFPDHRGKGYSKKIFWNTIKIGFETFQDAEWCWSAISKRNKKPFSYTKRNTEWCMVGEMVVPEPGYTIFGLKRDKWLILEV